jgi:mannan endo-1,4-beta-mannosidase
MRSRLVVLMALAIAAAAVTLAVSRVAFSSSPPRSAAPQAATLPASPASYLGVYAPGAPATYQQVADFAKAAGRQPNLVGYYSGWAERFAASFAQQIHGHGAVPIVQIDPSLANIPAITAGTYDRYLRSYAKSVRDFGYPVVIGFGHEMNASWYSWGYRRVPPRTFVAAWQHIVTLFRGQGADNVTWLWTINADRSNAVPVASWWPGARYVTWVGIDGYYYRPSDTFNRVFGHTLNEVRTFTRKPVLLSETAVGPRAGQSVKIANLFRGMRHYKTLGLVWFDIAQHHGIYHQDWRIQDNPAAESAFRLGAATLTLAGRNP